MPKKPGTLKIPGSSDRVRGKQEMRDKLERKAVEYDGINKEVKPLNEKKKKLSAEMKPLVRELGKKEGKMTVIDFDKVRVELRPVQQAIYRDEAEEVLRELKLWGEASTRMIDDDKVKQLHSMGKLSDKDLRRIAKTVTKSESLYVVPPKDDDA